MSLGVLILFYVFGMALIFAELFVPGGILGVAGTILIISSIGFSYYEHGWWAAVPMIVLTIILIPIMLIYGLSRITHNDALTLEEGSSPYKNDVKELEGQEGVALSVLRPSGMVKIGNRRVDAVAENELIPKDALVKVVRVEGQRVIVRNLKV